MSLRTKVVNIKDVPRGWEHDDSYVYVGREGHGLSGDWGNIFQLKIDTPDQRGKVIRLYETWLVRKIAEDEGFAQRVARLSGKTLVCFCSPKACHGDRLALIADILWYLGYAE